MYITNTTNRFLFHFLASTSRKLTITTITSTFSSRSTSTPTTRIPRHTIGSSTKDNNSNVDRRVQYIIYGVPFCIFLGFCLHAVSQSRQIEEELFQQRLDIERKKYGLPTRAQQKDLILSSNSSNVSSSNTTN